ncbi:MAG: hypothetical protein LH619_07220 [Chitinophagaceae bacterium]|nr:hypothetical protein [Chitinophagaceae bacterium]
MLPCLYYFTCTLAKARGSIFALATFPYTFTDWAVAEKPGSSKEMMSKFWCIAVDVKIN